MIAYFFANIWILKKSWKDKQAAEQVDSQFIKSSTHLEESSQAAILALFMSLLRSVKIFFWTPVDIAIIRGMTADKARFSLLRTYSYFSRLCFSRNFYRGSCL